MSRKIDQGWRISRHRFLALGGGVVAALLTAACQQPAPTATAIPPAKPAAPASQPTAAPAAQPAKPTAAPAAPQPAKPTVAPAAQSAAKPAMQSATLQLWFDIPGNQQEHVKKVNSTFTGEHKNIEVKTTVVPIAEMYTKVASAIAAGSPPDLAYLGGPSLISNLIQNKRVESLTKYRKDIKDLDWLAPVKAVLTQGDDFYALPVNSGVLALYYNADLYKEAGLDPNKPPATWNDLIKHAQAIAKPGQQVWGHYIGTKPIPWSADQVWIAYLWQAGGEWMSADGKQAAFNSDAGVEALQFYVDLVHEHKVTPLKTIDNIVTGNDFSTGKIGHMQLYPIWVLRAETMKFAARTAPMPTHKTGGVPIGFGTVPIFSDSKNRDASWTYLDWLMKPANAILWVSGLGNLPTRMSLRDEPAWQKHADAHPLMQPFIEAQKDAKLAYFGKGAQEISTHVAQAIEKAVFQKAKPKEALDEAAKATNEILAR